LEVAERRAFGLDIIFLFGGCGWYRTYLVYLVCISLCVGSEAYIFPLSFSRFVKSETLCWFFVYFWAAFIVCVGRGKVVFPVITYLSIKYKSTEMICGAGIFNFRAASGESFQKRNVRQENLPRGLVDAVTFSHTAALSGFRHRLVRHFHHRMVIPNGFSDLGCETSKCIVINNEVKSPKIARVLQI